MDFSAVNEKAQAFNETELQFEVAPVIIGKTESEIEQKENPSII